MIPGCLWFAVSKRDPRVVALYANHYSSRKNKKGPRDWLDYGITAPGESLTLLASDARALFVWLKQRYVANEQGGVNCAVFRNEGEHLSSDLIIEAEGLAWSRWPGERLYTYVDPGSVRSSNPGYCFLAAGWRKCGTTKSGLLIFEKLLSQCR